MSAYISVPTTTNRLSPHLRVPPDCEIVRKTVGRLSRASLLDQVVKWLNPAHGGIADPFLRERRRRRRRRGRNRGSSSSSSSDGHGDSDGSEYSEDDDGEAEDEYEDDFFPPARSLVQLREQYVDMMSHRGSRGEVIERITTGDWRHGLSLFQLAQLDFQYLYDHPGSLKWTAHRIVPAKPLPGGDDADGGAVLPRRDTESLVVPRFHPSTFMRMLEDYVPPDVKAYLQMDRPAELPVSLVRILTVNSPYNTSLALATDRDVGDFDSSRTLYLAFPDASPFVYVSQFLSVGSRAGAVDTRMLRNLIVEGIPRALSRPGSRCTLQNLRIRTKNIQALVGTRGPGRGIGAGGGWSVYADEGVNDSPLNILPPSPPTPPTSSSSSSWLSPDPEKPDSPPKHGRKRKIGFFESFEEKAAKRAKSSAHARFGDSARMDDGKGLERVEVIVRDPYPVGGLALEWRREGGAGAGAADHAARGNGPPSVAARKRPGTDPATAFEGDDDDDDEEEEEEYERTAASPSWTPDVRIILRGRHVFAGVRQLVEAGVIDGERMPGWLTGEEGVTFGPVRNGRIVGNGGAGL